MFQRKAELDHTHEHVLCALCHGRQEAQDDLRSLAGNQRILVARAIKKVSANPLPAIEGGYGKLLGNNGRTTLAGLMQIKLRGAGLRIVYKLVKTESEMLIVVIGARQNEPVSY